MLLPTENPTISLPISIVKKFSKKVKIHPIINIMSNIIRAFLLPILLAMFPAKNEPFLNNFS